MFLKIYQLLNKIIPEWLSIEEPETLSILLKQHNIDVKKDTFNIINVLKTCCVVETPWQNPFIFENVVDAFNGNIVNPNTLTMPPLEDIIYTVYVMQHIREIEFSESVAKYIACIAIDNNILYLPQILDFANKYIPPDDYGIQDQSKVLAKNIDTLPIDHAYGDSATEIQACKLAAIWSEFSRKKGIAT